MSYQETGTTGGGQDRPTSVQVQEKAGETARQVTGQVQEKTQQARAQAGGALRQQVDERSTQAGEQVRSSAEAFRKTSEELRNQGKETPARVAEQAAERAERLGGYLEEANADRILRDVEDFGRRRPWALAAVGAALGFFASRFLKASSSRRYRSGDGASDVDVQLEPEASWTAPARPGIEGPPPVTTGTTPNVVDTPSIDVEAPTPPSGAGAEPGRS